MFDNFTGHPAELKPTTDKTTPLELRHSYLSVSLSLSLYLWIWVGGISAFEHVCVAFVVCMCVCGGFIAPETFLVEKQCFDLGSLVWKVREILYLEIPGGPGGPGDTPER